MQPVSICTKIICDLVSEALLPRQSIVGFRRGTDNTSFSDAKT